MFTKEEINKANYIKLMQMELELNATLRKIQLQIVMVNDRKIEIRERMQRQVDEMSPFLDDAGNVI